MRRTARLGQSGQLINRVVQTSGPNGPGVPGDNDGTSWIELTEPGNIVVGTLATGAPGNGYSPTRTRSEGPIYSVVRASGPDSSVEPCDEDISTRAGPNTSFNCSIVRINTTGTRWPKCWGR